MSLHPILRTSYNVRSRDGIIKSYDGRHLKTIPYIDPSKRIAEVRFSDNPITSLKGLPSIETLSVLRFDQTKIESFEGAQPQPSLRIISFHKTPLAMFPSHKIMTIVVYGDVLEYVNNSPVKNQERKEAQAIRARIMNFMLTGWILTSVSPLRVYNNKTKIRKMIYISMPIERPIIEITHKETAPRPSSPVHKYITRPEVNDDENNSLSYSSELNMPLDEEEDEINEVYMNDDQVDQSLMHTNDEDEARKADEEEIRLLEEEEERQKEEAKQKSEEEEARLKAKEESRLKKEEETRIKAEEEANRKAEEERRSKAEEEAKIKAEEEARIKTEEEARIKAEEEEARIKAEEERRIKAEEEEANRKAEEEARIETEEEGLPAVENDEEGLPAAENDEEGLPAAENDEEGLPAVENDEEGLPAVENDEEGLPAAKVDLTHVEDQFLENEIENIDMNIPSEGDSNIENILAQLSDGAEEVDNSNADKENNTFDELIKEIEINDESNSNADKEFDAIMEEIDSQ